MSEKLEIKLVLGTCHLVGVAGGMPKNAGFISQKYIILHHMTKMQKN